VLFDGVGIWEAVAAASRLALLVAVVVAGLWWGLAISCLVSVVVAPSHLLGVGDVEIRTEGASTTAAVPIPVVPSLLASMLLGSCAALWVLRWLLAPPPPVGGQVAP
jgi:hypothetical protein